MISGCASQYQRKPDVVVIQNTPYNGQNVPLYERERILNQAHRDTKREIELREAQERLDAQKARNARNTYEKQIRLNQQRERFYQERGQVAPPVSGKPISIYPDTHPH